MALTRAQLLMGNDQQGAVLPGEVQAVKQGAGIFIDTDGTISVDSSSVTGLVKLNRLNAFNGYVWPETKGGQGQMLTLGTGNNLVWSNGGVFVNDNPPTNPEIGDLWFDCGTGQLLVYEACTSGSPKWTSGSEGLPVLPGDTSAVPDFVSGNGTFGDPYICSASSASVGGTIVVNRVTITDLAPFQFVPIIDLNAVVNGGRFSASNNVANASGILVFDLLFNDSPTSAISATYTCALKIGYGSVYINAPVTMTDVFVLSSPGSISGGTQIGQTLTYSGATAAGGAPPYTSTWQWRLFSDDTVLQNNGDTYVTTGPELGDSVYVTVTVQDSEGQVVSGATADYGPISKPPFPNPTPPTIPVSIGGSSCVTWDGASTTLQSDGCLLFSVNGGSFTQTSTPVNAGNIVCTKWSDSAPGVCGNANSGTYVEGCLFDANYSACGALTIDRIPDAFSFIPANNVTPGAVATSFPVTLTGNNAPCFLTVGSGSTGSNWQASVNGGSFQNIPAAGTYTLAVPPGQSVAVRFTTGAAATTDYVLNLQAGDSTGNTTATFTATTGSSTFPTTSITFPATTAGAGSVATSAAWGNGSTTISASGCIEFSVDGGSNFTQNNTNITDGIQLKTRWKSGSSCADNASGQTISGSITNGVYTEIGSLIINRVPTSFPAFGDLGNQTPSTQYISNAVSPTGFNSTAYVTLAAGATLGTVQASVGGGSFTTIPASGSTSLPIEPGQNLQIRGTTGSSFSTSYSATIEIGVSGNVITDTWTVATGTAVPSVDTPTIVTPSNGSVGVGTSAGVSFTSSAFASRDGAGTSHASSTWETYSAPLQPVVTSPITAVSVTPAYVSGTSTRSVRFSAANQNTFTRAFTSAGTSNTVWTWSSWVKKAALSTGQGIFVQGNAATDQANLQLSNSTNQIIYTDIISNATVANLVTTSSFVNCSDWFHLQLAVDTNQITASRRIRLYVNGAEITNFQTAVYYPQGFSTSVNTATTFCIGANGVVRTNYLDSYLTNVNFVDGQQLPPSSFGVSSGSFWIPKPYTGTFGNSGFQLLFEDEANPSASTIGKDTSGNNNDFTPNGVITASSNTVSFDATNPPSTIDLLVVGGGGASGTSYDGILRSVGGGGGGGGGVVETLGVPVAGGVKYGVLVGRGGIGRPGNSSLPTFGFTSRFRTTSAFGGGIASGNGGAGGSWSGDPTGFPGISGLGGNGAPGSFSGCPAPQTCGGATGGGGGGGASGAPGSGQNGGNGTTSSVSGSPVVYGGGGAGFVNNYDSSNSKPPYSCPAYTGGAGGGGVGFTYLTNNNAPAPAPACPPVPAGVTQQGTDGLGGGGGGVGTNGGSGTIVFSYPSTFPTLAHVGSSLTYTETSAGGKRVFTFTNSTSVPFQINSVRDVPVPGGNPNTGLGNQVSGNYNTMDASRAGGSASVSYGGLNIYSGGSGSWVAGSVPMQSGKYYWEIVQNPGNVKAPSFNAGITYASSGSPVNANTYRFNFANGNKVSDTGTSTAYGNVPLPGQVIGVAFDATNGKLFFSIDGVWQGSGSPAAGVGAAFTGLVNGPYYVALGGGDISVTVNFGQMPYIYQAPTGFGPVIKSITSTTLSLTDSTGLSLFAPGDSITKTGGGASGTVGSIDIGNLSISVLNSTGTWNIGATVTNNSVSAPPPPPTTDPPSGIYSLIDSSVASATNLTSWTVPTPTVTAFTTYFTRVKYTSSAPATTSNWSPWNQITTGTLT